VGKVIGGEGDDFSGSGNNHGRSLNSGDSYTHDAEDEQEPLALLVVHAALHMLFLPQFTCDFYEDDGADNQTYSSKSSNASKSLRSDNTDESESDSKLSLDQLVQKTKDDEHEAKKDRSMQAEAGLSETKLVETGVALVPKPPRIVWAPGCGVAPSQVGFSAHYMD